MHKVNRDDVDENDPWVKHPPGSAKTEKYPDGFDLNENRAHATPFIFSWDIYWSCENIEELSLTINLWWESAFEKGFPEEGGTAYELVDLIYNRLIDNGHDEIGINPIESDYVLPGFLTRNEKWKGLKGNTISQTFNEEERMAKLVLKKKAAPVKGENKTVPPKADKGKKVLKKAEKPAKEEKPKRTRGTDEVPPWIINSKPGTKAHESKKMICKLLLERKHTDTEIALIVNSELEYNVSESRINFYRYTLNKGRFAPIGFPAPKTEIEPIEKGGKKTVTAASSKKTSKKSATEPAPVKKKLVLKKK